MNNKHIGTRTVIRRSIGAVMVTIRRRGIRVDTMRNHGDSSPAFVVVLATITIVFTVIVVVQEERAFEGFHVGGVVQEEHVGHHASTGRHRDQILRSAVAMDH
jgi:hypothetical protein